MQIKVYADIVFLINFIMDFFIFWIVSKLIRKKVKFLNLVLGSFTAAILYCLIIFTQIFNNVFIIIFTLIIAIIISFRPQTIKELLVYIFLTNITSIFVGGIGIALFYFTKTTNLFSNMIKFNLNNFSFKLLIFSIFGTYLIIKFFLIWYKKVIIKRQTFYNINIYFKDEIIRLNALVDTGNSLHEPISDKPVIIAEFLAVKDFLPDNIKVIYYEKNENNLSKILECISDKDMNGRMRLIPFSSIGKQNGMLIGFKADKIEIVGKENISLNDVIVAIYNFRLSKDGFYNALLNPELFEKTI